MSQIRSVEAELRTWDPIASFCGEASPADEYESYAPHIVSLVHGGCSIEQLAEHLSQLRTEAMGLPDSAGLDRMAAEKIINVLRKQV